MIASRQYFDEPYNNIEILPQFRGFGIAKKSSQMTIQAYHLTKMSQDAHLVATKASDPYATKRIRLPDPSPSRSTRPRRQCWWKQTALSAPCAPG